MSITNTKILNLLKQHGSMRPAEILNHLTVSQQMIHKQLKILLENGTIIKTGKSPRTYYSLADNVNITKTKDDTQISSDISLLIEDNFLYVTPTGKRLMGIEAFKYWCAKRGLNVGKTAGQYSDVLSKYAKIRATGLLDATSKMQRAFSNGVGELCIDKVFYVDFYALEIFGKTKLGQMLLYAKQSQDKSAIWQIADIAKPKIEKLINAEQIDAIAYIPPTVKRSVQFMKILEVRLGIHLPKVVVRKVLSDVAVPQKTLKSIEDRIENADASFVIDGQGGTNLQSFTYKKILLIDDAVGSGASLNQVACKLKRGMVAKEVVGIAVTGSLNNFDVISEV